jgi:hypothetical protein
VSADNDEDAFLRAIRPTIEHLGATIVPERSHRPGDVPLEWDGSIVGFVRGSELHGALDRLVRGVKQEIGAPLAEMDRSQKQAAIRQLDEQGAFLLRGAVEDVAAMMEVSRVTLYSYLNAVSTNAAK